MTFRFRRQRLQSRSSSVRQNARRNDRQMGRQARRPLRLESLEQRRLLAAYINELMVDPMFTGSDPLLTGNDVGQYLELRGEPDSTFAEGTYFVAVNERGLGGLGGSLGVIHGIFDLSGQSVGSNGMLVIRQQNSPFAISTALDPDGPGPAVLQSTARGFSGLPGDIFSSLGTAIGQIDSILGSNGYFLLESDIPPELGQDIDADDDGLIDPDGVAASWTVLDSISLHHGVFDGPVAYGEIVFVEKFADRPLEVQAAAGVEVIHTPGFGYAARIGDSTGHAAEDWVTGTVRNTPAAGQSRIFRLETGIFGTPLPPVFSGRQLDHLGESNFVGGVRGQLIEEFEDASGELATRPFSGVSFLADTNGNGSRDLLTFTVEPDQFISGTDLTNRVPGVTLRTVGTENEDFGFTLGATRLPGFNQQNLVFSHSGIHFFNDFRRLRADFYRPVTAVSIDVLADGSAQPTIGRLEVYNAQDELLQTVRSRPLFGSGRETLTIALAGEQIAYAVAYPDSNPDNFEPGQQPSSPFGRLDRLVFRQFEAAAVSDDNGEFKLDALQPGNYNIVVQQQNDVQLRDALQSQPITVTRYENFRFDRLLRRNNPPRVEPATFTIAEHAPAGTLIGTVTATDRDAEQSLSFSLAEPETSPVTIDPASGELRVRDPDRFDFESGTQVIVQVLVTDSVGGVSSGQIVIELTDVDEPPLVTLARYAVFEDANPGSPIGRVFAIDPDHPLDPVGFTIIGGTGREAFAIHATSGVITVTAPEKIDFSQDASLSLIVEVADSSVPPAVTTVTIPIAINDANDPPTITTDALEIAEDAAIGDAVGQVAIVDPDIAQTHIFRILGDPGPFSINRQTGVITVRQPLNFDLVAQYNLTVQTVDDGLPPMGHQKSVTINILPVDKPPSLVVSRFDVQENAPPGTFIGRLIAEDRNGGQGFQFAAADNPDETMLFDGKVILDPLTGDLQVAADAQLDFESEASQLTDRVIVTANGQQVAVLSITLNLSNVNEPPVLESTPIGVPDGLPAGRPFAEITAFDREGDAITLELLEGAEQGLRIVQGNRLLILAGSELDLNDQLPVMIRVRATDSQGLFSDASIELVRSAPLRFGATVQDVLATSGELLNFALPVEYRGTQIRSLRIISPSGSLPPGISFDPFSGRLSGVPLPQPNGSLLLTIEVTEFDGEVEIVKQEDFELAIRRSATPLHNRFNPLDVDGNGRIEPIDALRILNVLALHSESDAEVLADAVGLFVDTIGDNLVQPLDALQVLNRLARRNLPGGEGEAEWLTAGSAAGEAELRRDRDANDVAIQQWLAETALF